MKQKKYNFPVLSDADMRRIIKYLISIGATFERGYIVIVQVADYQDKLLPRIYEYFEQEKPDDVEDIIKWCAANTRVPGAVYDGLPYIDDDDWDEDED